MTFLHSQLFVPNIPNEKIIDFLTYSYVFIIGKHFPKQLIP